MRIGCSMFPCWRKGTGHWNLARVLAMVLLLGLSACASDSLEEGPGVEEQPTSVEEQPQEEQPQQEQPRQEPPRRAKKQPPAGAPESAPMGDTGPGARDSQDGIKDGAPTSDARDDGTGTGSAAAGVGGQGEEASSEPDARPMHAPAPPPASTFPWPPPRPSSFTTIPEELLPSPDGQVTLGDVGKRLRQALDRRGYEDIAWYSTPGGEGFVLFTRIEQIHTDGTPFSGNRRFLPEVTREYRGLSDFLQALFMAPPGRFRVIALVVTAGELPFSDETLSRSEATTLLRGPRRLASEVAQRPLTSDHQVYALIYEFTKRRSEPEGKFIPDSELTGSQHLQAAGLLGAMREEGP